LKKKPFSKKTWDLHDKYVATRRLSAFPETIFEIVDDVADPIAQSVNGGYTPIIASGKNSNYLV